MNRFSWPRFMLLLRNDVLEQWRKIWIATLALAGVGLLVYILNVEPDAAVKPAIYTVLFPNVLIGGGLIFTSMIFADLHHPLQRFRFLTLPCSNLERFLSRYLLSAPLFYLYVLTAYAVFDLTAGRLAEVIRGSGAAPFAPFSPMVLRVALSYFGLHALMFCGAIYFRSFAFGKTVLSAVLIFLGLALTFVIAVKVFFWNYFTTFLAMEARVPLLPVSPAVMVGGAVVLGLWVLFIAYQCLREHEVQREL